jgi:hypothetical protein
VACDTLLDFSCTCRQRRLFIYFSPMKLEKRRGLSKGVFGKVLVRGAAHPFQRTSAPFTVTRKVTRTYNTHTCMHTCRYERVHTATHAHSNACTHASEYIHAHTLI